LLFFVLNILNISFIILKIKMATPDIYTLDYDVEFNTTPFKLSNDNTVKSSTTLFRIENDTQLINKSRYNLRFIYELVNNYLKNIHKNDMSVKLNKIIKKNGASVFTDKTTNDEYNVLLSIISYKLLIILINENNNDHIFDKHLTYFTNIEKTTLFHQLIKSNYFRKLNIIYDSELRLDLLEALNRFKGSLKDTSETKTTEEITNIIKDSLDHIINKVEASVENEGTTPLVVINTLVNPAARAPAAATPTPAATAAAEARARATAAEARARATAQAAAIPAAIVAAPAATAAEARARATAQAAAIPAAPAAIVAAPAAPAAIAAAPPNSSLPTSKGFGESSSNDDSAVNNATVQ
jgi:hypothetical protein